MRSNVLPRADDKDTAGVGTGLCQAHEEPHGTELRVGLAASRGHGEASPEDDHGGQPDSRRNLLNDEGIWDLADDKPVDIGPLAMNREGRLLAKYLPCRRHG